MKTIRACWLLITCALLTFTACIPGGPPAAAPATALPATVTATAVPPTATAAVATRPSASPSPVPVQSATDNWDDRTIFRAGLIKAGQAVLDQLSGASVYHLDVQIAADFSTLQGRMRVRYTNQENVPLDAVYFQLFPNQSGGKSTVSAATVDGQTITPIYESANSTLRVPPSTPLLPSQRVVIQLDFQVKAPTDVGGNYGLFGYLNDILVLDGFYPAIPVYDERGWQAGQVPPNADTTFQDASFYVVRVTAPAAVTVIASGIEVERTQQADRQSVTFAAGPARDFYLAASERLVVTQRDDRGDH